jgi:hypothetical protein
MRIFVFMARFLKTDLPVDLLAIWGGTGFRFLLGFRVYEEGFRV